MSAVTGARLFVRLTICAVLLGCAMAPAHAQTRTGTAAVLPELPALEPLLRDARERLREHDASGAYAQLSARLDAYAGEPEFDYLLGIAALDAGHPGAAILALERVLTVRPDHLQARAELGRAYLIGGERENARRAFRDVAAREIPPEARALISRYLDAIARLDAAQGIVYSAQIGAEIGHDDNANFGSASTTWLLADGTPVTPLAVSLPRKSAVIGGDGAVSISGPIDGHWRWTAGLRGAVRRYPSATTLDQEQMDITAGVTRAQACHRLTVLGQYQNLRLDGVAFRNAIGVLAQWQCDLNRRWNIGANIQTFSLSFPGQPVRDARRHALGMSFAHGLLAVRDAVLSGSVQFGTEDADPAWPNLAQRFAGFRLSLNMPLAPSWRADFGLAAQTSRFRAPEPLFGVTRKDDQTEIRLSAERWLGSGWSVGPQLSWMRNASTLAPNDFRRTQFLIRASHRF